MQRFLIDENLPRRMSFWSTDNYVFVSDVRVGMSDQDIWGHALMHELTLVTKDADFLQLAIAAAVAPRLILLQTGNLGKREFYRFLEAKWPSICQLSGNHRIVLARVDTVGVIS